MVFKSAPDDEHSCILELLPDSVHLFTSSLPRCDRAVVAYLVGFVPRIQPAVVVSSDALLGNSIRKSQRNVAGQAASKLKTGANVARRSQILQQGQPFSSLLPSRYADTTLIGEETSSDASLHTTHSPSFGCYCFSCYSNIWSKWNSSPNRGVIDKVLDLLDSYFGDSGHKLRLSDTIPSEGKKRQGKKQSFLKGFSDMTEPTCGIGELQLHKRGVDGNIVAGNGDLGSVEEQPTMRASRMITEMKNAIAEALNEKVHDSPSTINALGGFAVDRSFSMNKVRVKNCAKQRRGKRRSKQVTPLVKEEEDGATSAEESANARMEGPDVRGRGFFGQIFPGAWGGVVIRLWDLISLRFRSGTIDC